MPEEVEDRFCKELEFGTGGIRGVIGAGTNRMNRYTVRKATQGLANYILSQGEQAKGVAIAYDSRRFSKLLRCPAEAKEMRKKMGKKVSSIKSYSCAMPMFEDIRKFIDALPA